MRLPHLNRARDVPTGRFIKPSSFVARAHEGRVNPWWETSMFSHAPSTVDGHCYEVCLSRRDRISKSPVWPLLGFWDSDEAQKWESKLYKFARTIDPAGEFFDKKYNGDARLGRWLEDNGFERVNHVFWTIPGQWKSALLRFVQGEGTDALGQMFHHYIDQDNKWWERSHKHIQWAFPLPEPSRAQPASPVATPVFYETVKEIKAYQGRMKTMTNRFLQFLDQTTAWHRKGDHNHLRITRVIRCLTLCGLTDLAEKVYNTCAEVVGPDAPVLCYWSEALKVEPEWLT